MGLRQKFKKVKLFSGLIYSDSSVYDQIRAVLKNHFSDIDMESPEIPFRFTTYYNEEMGETLFRRFVSFRQLIRPEELPTIKLFTNIIETETAEDGYRTVNIDPGYLSDANVILATTKNHYHRVPLGKGIYAHMEYVIKKRNTLTLLEWTYPDFRTDEYMDFFIRLIPIYKQNIKDLRSVPVSE
jgi:hypothetical protein